MFNVDGLLSQDSKNRQRMLSLLNICVKYWINHNMIQWDDKYMLLPMHLWKKNLEFYCYRWLLFAAIYASKLFKIIVTYCKYLNIFKLKVTKKPIRSWSWSSVYWICFHFIWRTSSWFIMSFSFTKSFTKS